MTAATPVRVTARAYAKANLFLRILARETTGYHTIETLFTLLDLCDDIVIERTDGGIDLDVRGADTGPAVDNLATRAARLVLDATGKRMGVRITLTKRIPVQAGLGGGSADAAAVLHAVNALTGNAVPRAELLHFGSRIGSDVPFLMSGAPFALAWGRGERIFTMEPPRSAPVLLAIPNLGIDTASAYRWLSAVQSEKTQRGPVVLDAKAFDTWSGVGRLGGNDFESVVFAKHPTLRILFEKLAGTGPLVARLTGSGAGLIAIYKSVAERDGAALEIGETKQRLIKTATRAVPPSPPS